MWQVRRVNAGSSMNMPRSSSCLGYLHGAWQMPNGVRRREVSGNTDASAIKFMLYRGWDDSKQQNCPVGGQPVDPCFSAPGLPAPLMFCS